MATITLSVTHPVINQYRPYPGYNHHFTQLGFNCELLGDTSSYVAPNNIYYYLYSGNNPATLPPYVTGNVTSATSTTFVDTSKNFLASSLSWLGDGGESWIYITGGTGSGQIRKVLYTGSNYLQVSDWTTQPDATSTYCVGKYWQRVRAEFEDQPPNLYLPHADYTILTMAFDSNGIPRIARNYVNINAQLAAAPVVHNSTSPQIIFKKEDIVGGQSHVKIRAKKGDTVKLYWRYVVDEDKIVTMYPGQDDGSANHGSGIVLIKKRILAFRADPIASGVVSADNGEIQFDMPATQIAAASGDRWVVAETKTPGFGESFSTAAVKVFQQTGPPYTADAEDMRQNKIYFTATTATRNTAGYLERKYDVLVKNIDLYSGAESDYASQTDFYYNINNNGNAYNLPISDGIWAKVGATTTVLIIDQNANGSTAGTPYSYWSTHIIDPGINTPITKLPYSSLADAVTNGPDTTKPKDEVTWFDSSWGLGDKVYINNIPTDTTVAPLGFYFIPNLSLAIQVDANGIIIGKQNVGGSAQY